MKWPIFILLSILLIPVAFADLGAFQNIFNPFTAKLQYITSTNQSDFDWTFNLINIIGGLGIGNLSITGGENISISTSGVISSNQSCISITGSAELCDGDDAGGGGASTTTQQHVDNITTFLGSDNPNASIIRNDNLSIIFLERNSSVWNETATAIFPSSLDKFLGINTTTPSHNLEIIGDVLFNFSGINHFEIHADDISDDVFFIELENPTVSGISAIHAEVDIGSQANTKFLTLDYGANGLADEEFAQGMLLNFDVSDSTGGSVDAISVAGVGIGANTADIHGLSLEPGVHPIFQESGIPINASVYILNTSTTSLNITGNATTARQDDLPYNVQIFVSNGDELMIGDANKFSDIIVNLNVSAGNPGIVPVFEHSQTGGWKTFEASDGTRGFRDSGIIRWELEDIEDDWVATEENNQTLFWIKIERTQGGGGLNVPTESKIEIVETTVFEWNNTGDLSINDLVLAGSFLSGTIDFELLRYTNFLGIGNITDAVRSADVWNFANNDSLVLDNDTIHRNGSAVNFTTAIVEFPPVECTTGTFMTYTNLTTSICISALDAPTIEANILNITTIETNNTLGNFSMIKFNKSCGGFRFGPAGGLILSCE